jgi:hypothetical protein
MSILLHPYLARERELIRYSEHKTTEIEVSIPIYKHK